MAGSVPGSGPPERSSGAASSPSPSAQLMYAAAALYYEQDATQADIATQLGMSRATVSRLLAQARRAGIVQISVVPPLDVADDKLAAEAADALGLRAVHLGAVAHRIPVGAALAPALAAALRGVALLSGDVLLVASGRTVWEAAQAELPELPGVRVVPTVGGQDEPEPWYQVNEIARHVAAKIGGQPTFLYAPALPTADLYPRLVEDPPTRRVFELWQQARCAVVGIGAPLVRRPSLPGFLPRGTPSLRSSVGDVCFRFYDQDGDQLSWPGSDRLVAISQQALRQVPVCIAVAVGPDKVSGIVAGARGRYFNELVTDAPTAAALVAAAAAGSGQ